MVTPSQGSFAHNQVGDASSTFSRTTNLHEHNLRHPPFSLYPLTFMRSSTSQNNNFFRVHFWTVDTQQMSCRYRQFNVEALKKVSAQACGAQIVVDTEKIAEGSYNRIFDIKVDNGKEVISHSNPTCWSRPSCHSE